VFSTLVGASVAVARAAARGDGRQADPRRRRLQDLLIWPYAVAPAIAGVLWIFMFQPSLGMLARPLRLGLRLESDC
jgi:sn-glycerol 3-phosphate transport system permease protein